jgi:FlaA1/EpsC-like NDP-sugar epimerase
VSTVSTAPTLATAYPQTAEIPSIACNRTMTVATLIGADTLAVVIAMCLAISVRLLFHHANLTPSAYLPLLTALPLFFLVFSALNMYPGIGANAIEEFKNTLHAVTLTFLLVIVSTFFIRVGSHFSRIAFGLAWILTLTLVPIARRLARSIGSRQSWWGVPTVIFGANGTGAAMLKVLAEQPTLGLRPIALLREEGVVSRGNAPDELFVGDFEHAAELAARNRGCYAILAMPELRASELEEVLNDYSHHFHHVLVLPDLAGMSSLWISARELGGMLGLEITQRLSQTVQALLRSRRHLGGRSLHSAPDDAAVPRRPAHLFGPRVLWAAASGSRSHHVYCLEVSLHGDERG